VDVHEALGIDFHWDVRKLWAADLPTVELDAAELSWLLDLPFWTVDQRTDDHHIEVACDPAAFARSSVLYVRGCCHARRPVAPHRVRPPRLRSDPEGSRCESWMTKQPLV
jgi:hypothetical protein